jgi:hypothetical protein
VNGHWI